MNIKNSDKFIPNLLFPNSKSFDQQYLRQTQHQTPFRPLDNTEPHITRNQRKKNRRTKYLLKTQGSQFQQNTMENIFLPKDRLLTGEPKGVHPTPNIFNLDNPKKPNFIINFQEEDPSQITEERYEKRMQISSMLKAQKNVFENTERLNLIDWSSDNEDNSLNIIQNSRNSQLFGKKEQTNQQPKQKTNKKYELNIKEEQYNHITQQNNIEQIILQQQQEIEETHAKQQKLQNCKRQISNNNPVISSQSIFKQIVQGTTIQCLIKRDKNTIDGVHQYNVYLQNSMKHILLIRKQGIWHHNNGQQKNIKIASLHSTFLNCRFTLLKSNEAYSRMTVCYDTNILGMKGPRRIKIYLPKQIVPFEYLQDCYEEKKWKGKIQKLVNKTAKWSEKAKSYVLSFNGRALKPSIKNFVITDQHESDDKSFVIFGKAGTDSFNLDIQKPFSIIQGLALAMSSFQRKILCD